MSCRIPYCDVLRVVRLIVALSGAGHVADSPISSRAIG